MKLFKRKKYTFSYLTFEYKRKVIIIIKQKQKEINVPQ